jgi:hypothetical protein
VNRASLLALATLGVAGTAACAKTPPAIPVATVLAIPAPPARLIFPVYIPEYVEPEPEPVVEVTPPPAPTPSAAASRATEKPAAPPPSAPAPAPPMLRTTNATPGALEQRVKALISSAEGLLKRVNFRELDAQRKAHHSQARDFIRMANENLRIRNYAYAEVLATRANTVAGLLTKS